MTSATTTAEPVQQRLLDAAEQLIGERGIDGVSLRAINAEADSNVAAAHYHFGSKEALVRAVLARRMSLLAEERFEMLAVLEQDPAPPARAVVEVFTLPLVRLAATDDGAAYVRFLAALDRGGEPWLRLLDEGFRPQWERLAPVLAPRRRMCRKHSARCACRWPAPRSCTCSRTPTVMPAGSRSTNTATRWSA